ncbi:MAG: (2Fe-2S)-binding protein, partial [Proteobacteria bacterium]|nr:(2Fe-2S)-binding protein [Pseudomonadota bacterium]
MSEIQNPGQKPEARTIELTVNGVSRRGKAEPRMLLADFLREELDLTGTQVGCEHGV